MSHDTTDPVTPRPEPPPPDDAPPGSHAPRGGLFGALRKMGGELLSVAVGRITGSRAAGDPAATPTDAASGPSAPTAPNWRVRMLHGVTETLRGAADQYVAAKLDEIEARVDVKLDEIEARLDQKIREIHSQLGELRDQEIRHRLKILRITLIATVLVAALSLVYKWVVTHWIT